MSGADGKIQQVATIIGGIADLIRVRVDLAERDAL
jgi:hypothetical protein